MARKKPRRSSSPARKAPTTDYRSADGEQSLTLRGTLTAATRAQYRRETEPISARAAATREDLRERAIEFLFERLVSGWEIAGVSTTRPKDLLARYRIANRDERKWITAVLREHCAEWFPDIAVP